MNVRLPISTLSLGLLLAAAPFSLSAQQGTLTGTMTVAATGGPVPLTNIQIQGGGETRTVQTNEQGQYSVELPAGRYDLVVQDVFPYSDWRFSNIRVQAGQITTEDLRLLPFVSQEPLVISVEPAQLDGQSIGDSPQTAFILPARDIVGRVTMNPSDHFIVVPAVDIIRSGISPSNVVLRGFNNAFSGALHMITDYRRAAVPSLNVNFMHFIPAIDEDFDRIEVVLGPSSALYGPNTANGIVHFITKSPLDSQGTMVTFGGGGRSVFQGALRSAFLLNDDLGFKISGQYMTGDEWNYVDAVEQAARDSADTNPVACLDDKAVRGLDFADAQVACGRVGVRDFDVERWSLEARADYRFADDGTIVGTYGRNTSSGIELTGLGASQTSGWVSEFFQGRVRTGRFFAQAYYNTNDAGDSYLLRDGVALVDESTLFGATAQYGFTLANDRQEFTYGADYFATRPESQGTIYGRFEDVDDIDEWGGYLQSRTALSERLDFVVAGRLDSHSVLTSNVFSTRAAFVFQPQPGHSFRVSYNRAFSTPTALNYFLDVSGGVAPPPLGAARYSTRGYGSGRDGWSLQNEDGTLRGMRSPFNLGGADQLLAADTEQLWDMAVNALLAGGLDPGLGAILGGLSPTNSDIARLLFDVNTELVEPVAGAVLPDLPPIKEAHTETFELGWNGLLAGGKLSFTADVYYTQRNDFVSGLTVETPLLFLQENDITAFLTPVLGEGPAAAFADQIAGIPLGVVSSDQVGAQGADLIASYRNVAEDIDLWGADFGFQASLTRHWTLGGTYSHVSENYFPITSGPPVALNAPKDKGSLSLSFRDALHGVYASGAVRFTSSFPAQSTVFSGTECVTGGTGGLFEENCVDSYAIFDLNAGYEVPNTAATVQFSVNNVFNTGYRSFPGVPNIGRLALLRVRYDFL